MDAVPARRRAAEIRARGRRETRRRPSPVRSVLSQVRRLERKLDRLRDPNLESWQIAQEALHILRLLVAKETGRWDVSEAAPLFSARLWAGPAVSELVHDLNQRCAAVLYRLECIAVQDYESAETFSRDLQTLLSWYLSRKTMLLAVERRSSDPDEEEILDLEILTDVRHCGARGIRANFSARLIGRSSQQLWARLQLRNQRGPVRCREDWKSWSDHGSSETLRAAVLQPLVPDSQKRIVDGINLFLPYAALDLPEGRTDLVIEASIVDADDVPVVSARRRETIYVDVGEDTAGVTSPHSSCVWTADPVNGDSLKNLGVTVARDTTGAERLVVLFDLALFGHDQEALDIELRVLDEHGEVVSSTDERLSDRRGGFLATETIFPRGAMTEHRGMTFEVPLQSLEIADLGGRLDCEVSVRDATGRSICGAVASMAGSDLARELEANPFRRSLAEEAPPARAPLRPPSQARA